MTIRVLLLLLAGMLVAPHSAAQPSTAASVDDVQPLTALKAITRELKRGQKHNYEFQLSEGLFVRVIVEQFGIDISVKLYDQNGNLFAEADRSNGSRGPEAISMIAPQTGHFRITITGRRAVTPNPSYRIQMETPHIAASDDFTRIGAEKRSFEAETTYSNSLRATGKEKTRLLNDAVKLYEEALSLWRSIKDPYEQALMNYSLGWCYSDLGSHNMVKFPLPLYRLRWSYEARRTHQAAITYFQEALTTMTSLGDKHGRALIMAGRAWPNLYLGNEVDAVNDFSGALSIYEESGNLDGQARALYGLAWTQAVLNRNEEARDNFQRALQLRQAANDRRGEAFNLASLGRIYARLGNQQQALTFTQRARVIFESKDAYDRHGVASTFTTEGWAYYELKRFREAISSFENALAHRDPDDVTGKAVAMYGLAKVESQRGNLNAALKRIEDVIDEIDRLRKKGSDEELRTYYFANVQEYYSFYTELLMRLHRINPGADYDARAFWSNERARTRELVAILSEAIPDPTNDRDLESEKSLTASEAQTFLANDSILLQYAFGEEKAFLWVLTRSAKEKPSIQAYELTKTAPQITASILSLLEMLKQKGGTIHEVETAAQGLSTTLIPPKVAASLRNKRKVIFAADGAMQYLPVAMLSLSPPGKAYVSLVVNHDVVTVPSISTVAVLRKKIENRTPAQNKIVVLADPVFKSTDKRVTPPRGGAEAVEEDEPASERSAALDEEALAKLLIADPQRAQRLLKLKRLTSTRDEAEIIRGLEPTARLELDFEASLNTVTNGGLESYKIIHFATHGIALDDYPEASGMMLSTVDEEGQPQHGYLYFQKVCRLKLPVELVVLSGCDTDFGKHVRGEGLIGLTRGFMYAGAPRVIATLWGVRGDAAKELMKRFYTLLFTEQMRPAAALSAAQASMWREGKWTPSDWAAFRFSGEWR